MNNSNMVYFLIIGSFISFLLASQPSYGSFKHKTVLDKMGSQAVGAMFIKMIQDPEPNNLNNKENEKEDFDYKAIFTQLFAATGIFHKDEQRMRPKEKDDKQICPGVKNLATKDDIDRVITAINEGNAAILSAIKEAFKDDHTETKQRKNSEEF